MRRSYSQAATLGTLWSTMVVVRRQGMARCKADNQQAAAARLTGGHRGARRRGGLGEICPNCRCKTPSEEAIMMCSAVDLHDAPCYLQAFPRPPTLVSRLAAVRRSKLSSEMHIRSTTLTLNPALHFLGHTPTSPSLLRNHTDIAQQFLVHPKRSTEHLVAQVDVQAAWITMAAADGRLKSMTS